MHEYLFTFGASPDLSLAELRELLASFDPKLQPVASGCLVLTNSPIPMTDLIEQLGGTISIAEKVSNLQGSVEQRIVSYLMSAVPEGKIHFGLSGVGDRMGIAVKKQLRSLDRSVRYVAVSNMATVVHNGLVGKGTHLVLRDSDIFITRAVHHFEEMAERDNDRPAVDARSGMLPPKLARMMLNIAGATSEHTVLDPFCGSGTVLMEAALLGVHQLVGTDLSEKAAQDTKQNMDWIAQRHALSVDVDIFALDVRLLTSHLAPSSVDIIVTEPYMGQPKKGNEREDTLDREMQELQALYREALAQFAQVLVPGGVVVFAKPRFFYHGDWKIISWERDLLECGFHILPLEESKDPWILYVREGQYVGREIWKLQKNAF